MKKERTAHSKILESERNHKYLNTEKGFLSNKIKHIYTPSAIKNRGLLPTCTKQEIKNHFFEYVKEHGKNCFYCKEPWTYIINRYVSGNIKGSTKGIKRKNLKNFSMDRLDNSKTYSIDNIIFCCQECNQSKKDISIKFIKRLNEIIKERGL